MVMAQDAGNEMVTCVESANCRVGFRADANTGCHGGSIEYPNQRYQEFGMRQVRDTIKSGGAAPAELMDAQGGLLRVALTDALCWAKAVELNTPWNTKVYTSFRLGVGGTSALTPARPP